MQIRINKDNIPLNLHYSEAHGEIKYTVDTADDNSSIVYSSTMDKNNDITKEYYSLAYIFPNELKDFRKKIEEIVIKNI